MILDEITDHQRDDTDISKVQGYFKKESGILRNKRTNRGWDICV